MTSPIRKLLFLVSIVLSTPGCATGALPDGGEPTAIQEAPVYESVLGKALNNDKVAQFLGQNRCMPANQFQICKDAGVALWLNSDQIVETVYLYLNNAEGYGPYQGVLPFGLKFYDVREAVEYKLRRQGIDQDGIPDTHETPDHIHEWASYKQAGLTIIYNPASDDEAGATLYAILVSRPLG